MENYKNSKVVYEYIPSNWDWDAFHRLGAFTVVFLNYNKYTMIRQSVASALDQDFPVLDILLMDDASSDGSGDEMERLARAYHGRHMVRVVRNQANHGIPGQWNIAARLAYGNWLGMFCADDVSLCNRVTNVARVIAAKPTLRGLCTSGWEITTSSKTGEEKRVPILEKWPDCYDCGWADFKGLMKIDTPVIGATAFWHKSLFDDLLPNVRLDDIMLRWILQFKNKDICGPVWAWCSSIKAVEYHVGSGITNEMKVDGEAVNSRRERWLSERIAARKLSKVIQTAWQGVIAYYSGHNAPRAYRKFAELKLLECKNFNGNTWSRIALLPSILWYNLSYPNRYGVVLMFHWCARMVQEMFGLVFASYVTELHSRLVESRKKRTLKKSATTLTNAQS